MRHSRRVPEKLPTRRLHCSRRSATTQHHLGRLEVASPKWVIGYEVARSAATMMSNIPRTLKRYRPSTGILGKRCRYATCRNRSPRCAAEKEEDFREILWNFSESGPTRQGTVVTPDSSM